MHSNKKALLRKLLTVLPALVMLVGLSVAVSQAAFAHSLTASTAYHTNENSHQDLPAVSTSPVPVVSNPCLPGHVTITSYFGGNLGQSCFDSRHTLQVPLTRVTKIDPGKYWVDVYWTGWKNCKSQPSQHESVVRKGSPFSADPRTSYAGCKGYLGQITHLYIFVPSAYFQ